MPLNTSTDSTIWPIISGLRSRANCELKVTCSFTTRVAGKYSHSSKALARATAAKMPKALRQPQASEIKVPTGIPNTVAQTIPKPILAIARPA